MTKTLRRALSSRYQREFHLHRELNGAPQRASFSCLCKKHRRYSDRGL